jgi:hypothetical protein
MTVNVPEIKFNKRKKSKARRIYENQSSALGGNGRGD